MLIYLYKVVLDTTGAGRKTRVQRYGVGVPHHFFCYGVGMKELSIFIDESGDFGSYNKISPYYIVTMVFHDQASDISEQVASLEQELSYLGYPNHCLHAGPIIRKEYEFQ